MGFSLTGKTSVQPVGTTWRRWRSMRARKVREKGKENRRDTLYMAFVASFIYALKLPLFL